ncbi:MAG: hypothetical protein JW395_3439 [Nitrospira sp.]|nr:hypothetical protein [Nitrospira sp.]
MLRQVDPLPFPWRGAVCGSKERCVLPCRHFVEIYQKGRQPDLMLGTFILQRLHPVQSHCKLAGRDFGHWSFRWCRLFDWSTFPETFKLRTYISIGNEKQKEKDGQNDHPARPQGV